MGTPPNPSPNTFPNRGSVPNPNPNPGPTQTVAPGVKSPPYEEVSKLFSLPLSDAADSLGVCPSVLKKVCYDNGLVRWPYRSFLAGKSIEKIKKEAAIEKEKQLAELKVVRERSITSASPAVSTSLAPRAQSMTASNAQENPASRMLTQQPNRDISIMSKGSSPSFDEFKYGFPLNGLSSHSYRWWGNKSDKENGVDNPQSCNGDAKMKQQPTDSVENGTNVSAMETTEGEKKETDSISSITTNVSTMETTEGKTNEIDSVDGATNVSTMETTEGKRNETDSVNSVTNLSTMETTEGKKNETDSVDGATNVSTMETTEGERKETDSVDSGTNESTMETTEGEKNETDSVDNVTNVSTMEKTEGKKNKTDADPQQQSSLSALRKRAAKEGREAIKLGVYRRHSVKTIDPIKKSLLIQIFKSSLPCEWGDVSLES